MTPIGNYIAYVDGEHAMVSSRSRSSSAGSGLSNEGPREDTTPSLKNARERLWEAAKTKLRLENGELFTRFEQCLESEAMANLPTASAVGRRTGTGKDELVFTRAETTILRMIRDRKPGKMSEKFEKYYKQTVQVVLAVKSAVSSAVSADMHASLAWSAVVLLLPLLLNPADQNEKAVEGLSYISVLMLRYRHKEKLYAAGADAGDFKDFEKVVVPLYAAVLEFLARLISQLSRAAPKRYIRNVFKADDWESMIQKIKVSETACAELTVDIAAVRAAAAQNEQLALNRDLVAMQHQYAVERTADRQNAHLRDLYSNYEADKNLNPARVPGTCEWFLGHINFLTWREKPVSALLWVSALPGCGKSVLSRFLIDNGHDILTSNSEPTTLCYFFFKDGDSKRRHGVDALRALLSEIFQKNPSLFYIVQDDFDKKGDALLSDFEALWNLLIKVASSPDAPQIICVLDALDECEPDARQRLIQTLVTHYSNDYLAKNKNTRLKFIVTSRPYTDIEDSFSDLTEATSSIRLAGEDENESAQIGREIDLVIEDKVPKIAKKLDPSCQQHLISKLKATQSRSYLWLRLIFEVIAKKYAKLIKKSSNATMQNITELIDNLPDTVPSAYSELLAKSDDISYARRLLQLVVGANRPLSLEEVDVALAMHEPWDEDQPDDIKTSQTEQELEDRLDGEDVVKEKIIGSCGLLVAIYDSNLYLIHQTVRDWLLDEDGPKPAGWETAFHPSAVHGILAVLCVSFLMFPDLVQEIDGMTEVNPHGFPRSAESRTEKIDQWVENHAFLDYAANHWTSHVEKADRSIQSILLESLVKLCDIDSREFRVWYEVSYDDLWGTMSCIFMHEDTEQPLPPASIHVAAYLGFEQIVKDILDAEYPPCRIQQPDARLALGTAILRASEGGHTSIVQLILARGIMGNADALAAASYRGNKDVVELLLDSRPGDINTVSEPVPSWVNSRPEPNTPLGFAAGQGHLAVVNCLIARGAIPDIVAGGYTALVLAVYNGHKDVVRVLLDTGANPKIDLPSRGHFLYSLTPSCISTMELLLEDHVDVRCEFGGLLLISAVQEGFETLATLLLERGAPFTGRSETALSIAVINNNIRMAELLLNNGADPNPGRDEAPLGLAAAQCNFSMIDLLLSHGADINRGAPSLLQVLPAAVARGNIEMVKYLIQQGADLNHASQQLGTALQVAAWKGDEQIVNLLLDLNADLDAKPVPNYAIPVHVHRPPPPSSTFGRTALQHAIANMHPGLVRTLLDKGANVNARRPGTEFPLQIAFETGNETIIELLLQRDVDWEKQGTRVVETATTSNALDLLARLQAIAPRVLATRSEMVIKLAAEYGFDDILRWALNQYTGLAQSEGAAAALRLAAWGGHISCVRTLLELQVLTDPCGSCPLSWTQTSRHTYADKFQNLAPCGGSLNALQIAAAGGHLDIVSHILDHGAMVDVKGGRGTALQLASYHGRPRVVAKLICAGADVNAEGGWRGSALQRAASGGDMNLYIPYRDRRPCIPRYGNDEDYFDTVKILLENNARVNEEGSEKGTALQRASRAGHLDMVKMLVRCGADVNADGGDLGTALQRAADCNRLDVIKFLLAKDACVDADGGLYGTALQRASQHGCLGAVEALLRAGADVNFGADGTPLQRAATNGRSQVVCLLLDWGANVHPENGNLWPRILTGEAFTNTFDTNDPEKSFRERGNFDRYDPLGSVMSCTFGYPYSGAGNADVRLRNHPSETCFTRLIASGATFTGSTARLDWKRALSWAIKQPNGILVPLVLTHAPEIQDVDLLEAAYENSQNGDAGTLRLVLDKARDPSRLQSLELRGDDVALAYPSSVCGSDILPEAAARSDLGIISVLAEYGFDLDRPSTAECSPLRSAAMKGAEQTVALLLRSGANARGSGGCQSLICTVGAGYLNVAKLLLDAGAPYEAPSASSTPLLLATENGRGKMVDLFLSRTDLRLSEAELEAARECALSKGFYPIAWSISQRLGTSRMSLQGYRKVKERLAMDGLALVRAATVDDYDRVAHLLRGGVDVDSNPDGRGTALHRSAARGHLRIVALLLENKANVHISNGIFDPRDLSGFGTALERAAAGGHTEICSLLLDNNASAEMIQDCKGISAIERAAENGHTETVRLLVNKYPDSLENSSADKGGTALQRAAAHPNFEMAELLLRIGADVNTDSGERGTPLQLAAYCGRLDMVTLFIDHGAAIDQVPPYSLVTPLCLAVQNGHADVAKVLIQHGAYLEARPQITNHFSERPDLAFLAANAVRYAQSTPLIIATSTGSLDVVKLLLSAGANVSAVGLHPPRTAFQIAVGYRPVGHPPRTAFQIAVSYRHTDIAKLLLEMDGTQVNDPWETYPGELITPLEDATRGHYPIDEKLIQILCEHGAVEKPPGPGES